MRTKYLTLISISSLILFGIVFYTIQSSMNARLLTTTERPVPRSATTTGIVSPSSTQTGITVSIEGATYIAAIQDNSSVLEAMRTLQESGEFIFSGREYPSLGFFVESVNEKYGTDGFYWILYVNGKLSGAGASQTMLKAGDAIEWRYEKGY